MVQPFNANCQEQSQRDRFYVPLKIEHRACQVWFTILSNHGHIRNNKWPVGEPYLVWSGFKAMHAGLDWFWLNGTFSLGKRERRTGTKSSLVKFRDTQPECIAMSMIQKCFSIKYPPCSTPSKSMDRMWWLPNVYPGHPEGRLCQHRPI